MLSLLALVVSGLGLAAIGPLQPLAADDELSLRPGDRVVLLGGTFFERMQAYGQCEAALLSGYPETDLVVRNLGWSGDNVFGEARAVFGSVEDGFKRLEKDVRDAEPTVVIVNYGGNEAHAGTAGLPVFQQGLARLLDTLEAMPTRVIVLLPHAYEDLGGGLPSPAAYNDDLAVYRRAIRATAATRQLPVADLTAVMRAARDDLPPGQTLTENGVHPSPLGYRAIAPHFARMLGGRTVAWKLDLDVARQSLDATGCTVQTLTTITKDGSPAGARFAVRDDQLEASQHNDHGSPSTLPQGRLTIRGLSAGTYELTIDGQAIQAAAAEEWAAGVTLAQRGGQQQAEKLRQAVVAKNQWYFHRYRPQNETYLFLFRKHEQGNNAVEIPQFDPLVTQQEKEIAALRLPQPRQYEVRRVAD